MPAALPVSSCGYRPEVPQSDQVVGGHREGEHPPDAFASPESRLAAQPDGLQPPEHLLDALTESLAHPVPRVARGARVERGTSFCAPCGVTWSVRRHSTKSRSS